MKYVIVKPSKVKGGIFIAFPILFPDMICHCDMVPKGYEAISAGFCNYDIANGFVTVDMESKSETLKLGPISHDAEFIQQWLIFGESLLAVSSEVYDPTPEEIV